MSEVESILKEVEGIIKNALDKREELRVAGIDYPFYVFCDSEIYSKILLHRAITFSTQSIIFNILFHTSMLYGMTFVSHRNFKEGVYYDLFNAIKNKYNIIQEEIDY